MFVKLQHISKLPVQGMGGGTILGIGSDGMGSDRMAEFFVQNCFYAVAPASPAAPELPEKYGFCAITTIRSIYPPPIFPLKFRVKMKLESV